MGRSLRFTGIAYVSARYGKEAEILLRDNLAWVSLAAVAVFVLTAFIFRRFRTNSDPNSNSDTHTYADSNAYANCRYKQSLGLGI